MPFPSDPLSLAAVRQAMHAGSIMHMPGSQPLTRLRAKITADDGNSPKNFTWVEVEPDLNGLLVDKSDGLTGDENFNPAREMSGQTPSSYPFYTWLEPRGEFDKGVIWEFAVPGGPVGGGSGSGAVTTFSGVRVFHTGAQTIWPLGTVIEFGSENFDTDSYHTNANLTRLIAPTTGYYHVGVHIEVTMQWIFQPLPLRSNSARLSVRRDGVFLVLNLFEDVYQPTGDAITTTFSGSSITQMTAGQYVDCFIAPFGVQDSTVAMADNTVFWMYRVGQ